jgi:predicted ATPase/DNA-binding XRE family transcriptional regulator
VDDIGSFGSWVRRRRKQLDLTQAELAQKASCSLSMLRKIEREERRPSEQLAELLADHLAIDDSQREAFLMLASGKFTPTFPDFTQDSGTPVPTPVEYSKHREELAPFVARERELLLLHEHLGGAMGGQGRLVFIAGEAGRGKTSLLYEFARQAMDTRSDLIIAGGSSDVYTGQGDPLLPFRDIFRVLVGDFENASMSGMITRKLANRLSRALPATTETLLDYGPHLIDTLLPGWVIEARLAQNIHFHPKNAALLLRLQGQRTRKPPSAASELRQDHLFEELTSTLNALAQHQPLLLMLDDLHWIDQSTAALLGHLVMRLKQSPILIIGSYRPEGLTSRRPADGQGEYAQHPLLDVLSESLRQYGHNRIDLDHFDPREELEFVNALLDLSANQFGMAFRDQLTRWTEGHPLFVVELLRDMRDRGNILQGDDGRWIASETMNWANIPGRVEGVIEKRITRLPDDLHFILAIGSVQGESFFAEVIAQVTQTDPGLLTRRLSTDLDQHHRLIHSQGILHAGTQRITQYRFRHHLFQKYLYDHLAEAERMYLHEAVGNALEALFPDSASVEALPAAQLARHFQEAHLDEKASRYLLLAGQNAARLLAFDDATNYFEQGLSGLKNLPATSEISSLEFELVLANAQALWHSGRVVAAVAGYQKSIEIARAQKDAEALARAALAYEQPRWRFNLDAELSQQFMREALVALGDEPSGLRVQVLVGLSRALLASGEQEELRATVNQAVQIAREIEDPLALSEALRVKAQIDRRPETTSERLATIQELITITRSINDLERLADGLDLYIYDLLELGQIELADEMIAAQRQCAQEIKQPFQMHVAVVFQTMRAILSGEFDKAEQLAKEAAEISQRIGVADIDGIYGIHMFTIRREQGRIHEIAPLMKVVAASNPESSTWRPGLALIYSLLGEREECQAVFDSLVSDEFAFLPQDSLTVATLAYLSEVCAYLGDGDRAAVLYKLLLPYDSRTVVVGGATACFGAAGRYLGLLAATMSDWELAERHFEAASEMDAQIGAWPWLAHSQYEYANMCLRRGRTQDREQAIGLLNKALEAAKKMGMVHLEKKVADIQSHDKLNSS